MGAGWNPASEDTCRFDTCVRRGLLAKQPTSTCKISLGEARCQDLTGQLLARSESWQSRSEWRGEIEHEIMSAALRASPMQPVAADRGNARSLRAREATVSTYAFDELVNFCRFSAAIRRGLAVDVASIGSPIVVSLQHRDSFYLGERVDNSDQPVILFL